MARAPWARVSACVALVTAGLWPRPAVGQPAQATGSSCEGNLEALCAEVRSDPGCHACAHAVAHFVSNCTSELADGFCVSAGIDPQHAEQITVYHVNPSQYPDVPLDMNTADAMGDLYFLLQTATLPLDCAEFNASSPDSAGFAGFSCRNAETNGENLVVTKLVLEVDNRFGKYQLCNICVDGKDPLGFRRRRLMRGGSGDEHGPGGEKSCQMTPIPEYVCDCLGDDCNLGKVGREDVNSSFGSGHWGGSGGSASERTDQRENSTTLSPACLAAANDTCAVVALNDPAACTSCLFQHYQDLSEACNNQYNQLMLAAEHVCDTGKNHSSGNRTTPGWPGRGGSSSISGAYKQNLAKKTGGLWYSTTEEGFCGADNAHHCMWRMVETQKRVSKACMDDSIYSYIESKDNRNCLASCVTPTDGSARNMSDVCWVKCVFEIVLGANASRNKFDYVAGLSKAQLEEAWGRPFESDDPATGGCLDLRGPSARQTPPIPPTPSPDNPTPDIHKILLGVLAMVVMVSFVVAIRKRWCHCFQKQEIETTKVISSESLLSGPAE